MFRFPSALRSSFSIDQTRGHAPAFGDEFENFWIWLFNQKDLKRQIEIEALGTGSSYLVRLNQKSLTSSSEFGFDYFRNGMKTSSITVSRGDGCSASIEVADSEWPTLITFSTNPSNPAEDAEYFNRIAAKRGGEQRVVELLQVIEPRLQDLKYLKLGNQPLVYADVGMEDLIPTTQLGQGFTRLLRLFSEILVGKAEVVLIDEIENGIHYSAMPKVWKGIALIAREGFAVLRNAPQL